jgi:hypothetical protein
MPACIGCGKCCLTRRCSVEERLYGAETSRCPALRWDEDGQRWRCAVAEEFAGELLIGRGCGLAPQNRTKLIVRPYKQGEKT